MAVLASKSTISAIVHHLDHGATVNVYFGWPIVQPKDCYTLTVNGIQLELDKHFPVRPAKLSISPHQLKDHDAVILLEQLFGEEFVDKLQQAHTSTVNALTLELSLQQRQAIAQVQLDSDQSPDIVRTGCAAMLDRPVQPEKEQVADPHPAHTIQAFIDVFLRGDDEAEPLVT